MENSPAKENMLMGKLLKNQILTMVDTKKKEITFNRSWKTFTKIRYQSLIEEKLMSRTKAAVDYSIKFGFGSSYKKKFVTRTVSMIIDNKKSDETPDSLECDSLKLVREQTMQPKKPNRCDSNLSKISEN
jgi:hypothetical protein